MDKNIEVLLEYDVRPPAHAVLCARQDFPPPRPQVANITNGRRNIPISTIGVGILVLLSTVMGGHYLSALALAYAASHDRNGACQTQRASGIYGGCTQRLSGCLQWQHRWFEGYVGGLPDNTIWTELYKGSNTQYNTRSAWVPFYVMHKIYAGLRDALRICRQRTAKNVSVACATGASTWSPKSMTATWIPLCYGTNRVV